ncbi:anthranilate phosphoribosyltransferase [Caldilinea sp.]|jgi:anthranilate phosphoribosyltransferase|uniref:anthranilate phosphoribosyltransferase n=1 Tax=Caldilinea sp. TaxID=2293560 RepID=UPI0021DCEA18|nr:anthranilate phosphoribosyltransferase [Caldilinea sp.]GIV68799.1 MAG: anthranilate phosphoribosyltransferase [Caldilinea sp.]
MSLQPIQHAIHRLFAHHDLTVEEADAAMTQIMEGEATPAQIGAFLAALRMKGETVDEITGCARAMKRSAVQVHPRIGDAMLVDVVGTGGDSLGTFNISTTTAFVVAGAGVKVAKHGNRAVSSRSGSADVLAALGVHLQLTAEQAAECIEEIGLAFLFAPAFHPAMRHAIGPRRELAARTIFNILGPLTNPAGATNLLVGVFDPKLTEPMARVLGQMGARGAFVVHGAGGADELSLTGLNRVSHLCKGEVRTYEFDAQEIGLPRAAIEEMIGGSAEENAAITRGVLSGEIRDARRDAVLLNAAFALSTESGDLMAGLERARASIDSGAALRVLESYIQKTQGFVESTR